MKKLVDKLLNNIKFDKRYVLFCLVLVILGIITGSLFTVILNSSDKSLVMEYISSFVDSIKNNSFNYVDTLKNTLIINYIIIFIISIIGFTYFLIPINILILFYKAFVIGFSLSSFILTFKIKGLLLSIVYIFPHLIINILLFCLLTAFTLKLSIKMINSIIKKKEVNMRQYFNKYLYMIILFVVLITLTGLYESFIAPILLKLIVKII
ncbi:MAG: stage II sporulation protein M [Bacilli bacterium]|nr:stage II sporulation protein M [Bacilli bacterium]